jgi:hypothetical protein
MRRRRGEAAAAAAADGSEVESDAGVEGQQARSSATSIIVTIIVIALSSSSSSSLPSTSAASARSASTGKVKRDKHAFRIDKNATNIVFGNISHYNDIERFSSLYNKLKGKGKERDDNARKDAIADTYEIRVNNMHSTYIASIHDILLTFILHKHHIHIT